MADPCHKLDRLVVFRIIDKIRAGYSRFIFRYVFGDLLEINRGPLGLDEIAYPLYFVFRKYAPCNLINFDTPGGMNSMSPIPSRCSAPVVSRIVRESGLAET